MPKNKTKPVSSFVSEAQFYTTNQLSAIKRIKDYIEDESFPCVGAKAALVQGNVTFRSYGMLGEDGTTSSLYFDLMEYVQAMDIDDPRIQSFVAIFKDDKMSSEEEFETLLWKQLELLHVQDAGLDIDWNEDVSEDPDSPHFSMSIANHPFFVVGMHSEASRNARRSPFPVMVFNSNLQFEKLRSDGRFDKMKAIIRERERKLNGGINPMLNDFGDSSEARQYSGRFLPEQWKCPFSVKPTPDT